jgi:hypothetical protein
MGKIDERLSKGLEMVRPSIVVQKKGLLRRERNKHFARLEEMLPSTVCPTLQTEFLRKTKGVFFTK